MSVTKAAVASMFAAARQEFPGALETIRHGSREYSGTRLPFDKGEQVDLDGAIYTVQGGIRLLTSELATAWPNPGEQVRVMPPDGGQWLTYTILTTRLDQTRATMLLNYGERYDQQ